MHPGFHRDHRGHHAHSAVARRAHRRGHRDPEDRRCDDPQRVHHDRVCLDRQVCCQADQSSALASSRGWVVAFPEALGARPGPTEPGRQADAVPQVERRLLRDAAHAADPFLARRRTGCCQAADYRDAAHLERRGVLRWTQDVAVVRRRAPHRSERQARLGPDPGARLDAEPTSAAAETAGLLGPLGPLVPPGLLARRTTSVLAPRQPTPRGPGRTLPAPRQPPSRPTPWRRRPSWLAPSWLAAARSPASP
jgi:hypothetical protein